MFFIFTITCSRIRNIFFTYMTFITFTSTMIVIPLSESHFLPSNLHLHSHDMCFVNVLESFIPVIMLNTLRFKSSVLIGTHILLDKSFKALPLPTNLSSLTLTPNE